MYAILTLQMGYNPTYVLDKMQWYEINAAIKYNHYAYKESWEQTRLIAYTIAQCNSKEKLKLEDVIKFSWDNDKTEPDKPITKQDIERLNKRAQAYLKIFENAK